MRRLSEQQDWGMNIVVNIRGRAGTDDFEAGYGIFGNGITSAFASVQTEANGSADQELVRTLAIRTQHAFQGCV